MKQNENNHDSQRFLFDMRKIYIRLVFLRIGEIDTLNEKYQAQASIESRWITDIQQLLPGLSPEDQTRLNGGKAVSLIKYAETHWHPQLYIENALGDLKEQIRYSAKRSRDDNQIYICEHRDIKGVFWEKLELQHFPSDVQDLSISIGSMFYDDKVLLINDPHHLSGVNREAFVDQQEWSLYEHVDVQQRFVREFPLCDFIDDEDENEHQDYDEKEWLHRHHDRLSRDDRKRSILTVTCHAARESHYFFWNGFCLIFLITVLAFCLFAVPPHLAPNRIQASCTLLLTSITFRWTVNRSLPTISYLTSLDKYAIMCIFVLIGLCLWHTMLSVFLFEYHRDDHITPSTWLAILDRRIFFISVIIFVVIHCVLFLWFYLVPMAERRRMSKKDRRYRDEIYRKTQTKVLVK